MIYLDSSALLKLLFHEAESEALERWLAGRDGVPIVSSELARVEVLRACRRLDADALPEARRLLGQLDLVPLAGAVIDGACDLGDSLLRSLDAIHLASALLIGDDVSAVVAYDSRLLAAVDAAGLPTVRPGS